MWLGSRFCAAYIERGLQHNTSQTPAFWTRKQRGEEAATWLVFAHKYQNLINTAGPDTRRVFCIPPQAVEPSSGCERVLMLLAIALMEALGIRCDVITEPDYGAMDGFALTGSHASRANWIRTDGLWSVETVAGPRSTASYADAARLGNAASLIAARSPALT